MGGTSPTAGTSPGRSRGPIRGSGNGTGTDPAAGLRVPRRGLRPACSTTIARRRLMSREPWKSGTKRPVYTSSLEGWRTELSESQIFLINRIARNEMDHYGYPRCKVSLGSMLTSPVQIARELFRWLEYKRTERRQRQAEDAVVYGDKRKLLIFSAGHSSGRVLLAVNDSLDRNSGVAAPGAELHVERSLAVWSAAVINFNGGSLVCDTIASIKATRPPPAEILLVDDQSTDQSLAMVRARYPDVGSCRCRITRATPRPCATRLCARQSTASCCFATTTFTSRPMRSGGLPSSSPNMVNPRLTPRARSTRGSWANLLAWLRLSLAPLPPAPAASRVRSVRWRPAHSGRFLPSEMWENK